MRAFLLCLLAAPLFAQQEEAVFFEAKIRPVLATKCYACHSSNLKAPMGGLVLDTKAGLKKGGATGAVVNPGKPEDSRLLHALRYTDPRLQMNAPDVPRKLSIPQRPAEQGSRAASICSLG